MNQFSAIGITAIFAFGIPGHAQAQVGPTRPYTVGDFTIERVLTLGSINSPFAPNFPASVLTGIQSGALEVHQVFNYNSAQRTLEQSAFVVPGKSALPFPSPGSAPVADHYIMSVDSVTSTTSPGASVALVGTVTSNDVPTPWGNITGAIITISFAYRGSGSGTQFGPVYESVSPLYGLYTATGVGSLTPNPSPQKCGNASLSGVFMFRLSGSVQTGPSSFGPFVDNGRFIADGKGSMTILDGGSIAGNIFTNRTMQATYVIDDFCSGALQLAGGATMDIQVSRDGRRMNMVFTAPASVVASGSGQLQ